jgi:hypothetical protein
MKMLSDKEILSVKSPQERPKGNFIRGPWFVIQKTLADNVVEAYVLLEWREESDDPLERCIGTRLFEEDGPGKPANHGYPYWRFNPPDVINDLSLDKRLKTIAEDYLAGKEDSLSTLCLNTLSNLKQTLELARFDTERTLGICFCLYQKMKRWTHEENEKEARAIDAELERITAKAKDKPDAQTLDSLLKERGLNI